MGALPIVGSKEKNVLPRKSQADQRNSFEKLLDAAWRLRDACRLGVDRRLPHKKTGRVQLAQSTLTSLDRELGQVPRPASKAVRARKGMGCEFPDDPSNGKSNCR